MLDRPYRPASRPVATLDAPQVDQAFGQAECARQVARPTGRPAQSRRKTDRPVGAATKSADRSRLRERHPDQDSPSTLDTLHTLLGPVEYWGSQIRCHLIQTSF